MNRNDIIRAFDWNFADISLRDSARYYALKSKPHESETLARLISADSLIGYALWTELPRNHPATQRYEKWKSGQRNAPADMRAIAQSFASRTQIGPGVDENTFIQKLVPIYSFLSEHTHGQGIQVHNLQEERDNVPRYI